MIKYLLLPGPVYSRADASCKYITAEELAKLYKVDVSECVAINTVAKKGGEIDFKSLIPLFPDPDGKYIIRR